MHRFWHVWGWICLSSKTVCSHFAVPLTSDRPQAEKCWMGWCLSRSLPALLSGSLETHRKNQSLPWKKHHRGQTGMGEAGTEMRQPPTPDLQPRDPTLLEMLPEQPRPRLVGPHLQSYCGIGWGCHGMGWGCCGTGWGCQQKGRQVRESHCGAAVGGGRGGGESSRQPHHTPAIKAQPL